MQEQVRKAEAWSATSEGAIGSGHVNGRFRHYNDFIESGEPL